MALQLTDLVDLVRGKKAVPVKTHTRKKPKGGDTHVINYMKLIDLKPQIDAEDEEQSLNMYENSNVFDVDGDEVEDTGKPVDIDFDAEDDEEQEILDKPISKIELENLAKIKEEDIVPLIKKWQIDKDEDALEQVLDYYNNILVFHANKFKTGQIPFNLILLRAKQLAINAANNYKPGKGTRFNTFLTWYLKKLYRFVNDNTNIAKIPEQRVRKINMYKDSLASLEVKLDRTPTDIELADELSWPVKEVSRLRNELSRSEILNFGKDEGYSYSDLGIYDSKMSDAVKLVHLEATPEEQFILEHVTPIFGKKELNIKKIAKKLKISESKVKYIISNLKIKIVENV